MSRPATPRRTLTLTAGLLPALAVAALVAMPAAADYRIPSVQEVPGWFPPGMAKLRISKSGAVLPGVWNLNTWRQPEVRLLDNGRKILLTLESNGLFDDKYPYTRVIDTVLEKVCGIPAPAPAKQGIDKRGTGGQLLFRMYGAKSLIQGRNLGGNGGTTFKKVAVETRNGCRITMIGQGARWHVIRTTIEAAN